MTEEERAIETVLYALADELHASLCGCRAYPDACVSRSNYDRENMLATLSYAEAALEKALELGWKPPE